MREATHAFALPLCYLHHGESPKSFRNVEYGLGAPLLTPSDGPGVTDWRHARPAPSSTRLRLPGPRPAVLPKDVLCSPRNRGPARPADIASPPPASPDAPPPSSGPPLRLPCSSPFRLRPRRHRSSFRPRPSVTTPVVALAASLRRRSRSTCRPPQPPPPPQPAPRPCRKRWARSARGTVSARRVRTPSTARGWSTGPTAAPARRCRAPAGRCRGLARRSPSRRCSPATWCSSTGPQPRGDLRGQRQGRARQQPGAPVKIADLNSMPFNSACRV